MQRLKGKQCRFRGNLSGKRVDFSGREIQQIMCNKKDFHLKSIWPMKIANVAPTPSDEQSQQQLQQNHHHQQQQRNSFSSSSSSLTFIPVSPNSSSTTSTSSNTGAMIPIKTNRNQLTTQNVTMMTNAMSAGGGGNKRDAPHANTNTGHSTNNANHR